MSTPTSPCWRTTSAVMARTRLPNASRSCGSPRWIALTVSITSGGLGSLPACVVRMRSVLRFIAYPPMHVSLIENRIDVARDAVSAPSLGEMLHQRRVVFEVALCHAASRVSQQLFLRLGRRRLGDGDDGVVGVGGDDLVLLPHHMLWVLAVLHGPDATPDDVPQHDDATIGGGQVFQAMAGEPPVDTCLRVVVARHALPPLVRPVRRLAESGPLRLRLALSEAHEAHEHGGVVVHRDGKMRRAGSMHVHLTRTGPPGGELAGIGGNVLVDPHPDVLVHPPRGGAGHPGWALHPIQHRAHP